MATSDPNRQQLIAVAKALGGLCDEVVFVGGSVVGILITDPAAPSIRPTKDVDVIVEVASYADYQLQVAPSLKRSGFIECTDVGAPLCAWKIAGIRVDVMPTEGNVLGFTNPWYKDALATATRLNLDGVSIRMINSIHFLATKLVAFDNRGKGDYYGSHDLEDFLAVVDGRPEIIAEYIEAADNVTTFIAERVTQWLSSADFRNALPGHVDEGREHIVLERLLSLTGHLIQI